jgi:hypothetical protein
MLFVEDEKRIGFELLTAVTKKRGILRSDVE